ncbi:MAG: glycosyltransferase [Chthoniobacterales bacterium]
MNAAPSFAVVVPFFNEGGNVETVCEELKLVLATNYPDAEVILVDDGSTDETAQILDDFARGWPAVRVHHLRSNRGQSGALLFGFKQTHAPVLVTMDGDGQNDPRDIPKLLARLVETDMVVGVRIERKDSWARRKISRVANRFRSRWLGDGVSDSGCALKVFRREVVNSFIPIRTLYSFMPAFAVAAGFRVQEEPVQHRARAHGESRYTVASFLFLPIVDLLGVKWFGSRRCQIQPMRPAAARFAATETLGVDLSQGTAQRLFRRVGLAFALAVLGFVLFRVHVASLRADLHKIDQDQAEKIALHHAPKGHLGAAELIAKNGRLIWTIDVQPDGSNGWNEVEVDARSGEVVTMRFETAAEEQMELAEAGQRGDAVRVRP